MKKVKIILISTVLLNLIFIILSVLTKEAEAKEKRKILLLQIIEENWDNLEFIPPLYKRPAGYKPPTKKEVMERRKKEWEKMERKDIVLKSIKHSMSEGYIPKDAKVYVRHIIKYLSKIEEFNENDIFEESKFRFGEEYFIYFYKEIPEMISLLIDPIKTRSLWRTHRFEHIRLVNDIYFLSHDNSGNLKIKYEGEIYNLKVGEKIIFSLKVVNLTKDEMKNFNEKYRGKIKYPDQLYGDTRNLSIERPQYRFKTKVTIINHGYVEVEL